MLRFFDLNYRAGKGLQERGKKSSTINKKHSGVKRRSGHVLDSSIDSDKTSATNQARHISSKLSIPRQIFMYVGVLLGVFVSSAVRQFSKGEEIEITLNWGKILISCVVALVIVPIIYQKLSVDPDAPVMVQFGLFVQNGVFWDVMITSIK